MIMMPSVLVMFHVCTLGRLMVFVIFMLHCHPFYWMTFMAAFLQGCRYHVRRVFAGVGYLHDSI
jgi:hypothetical protein